MKRGSHTSIVCSVNWKKWELGFIVIFFRFEENGSNFLLSLQIWNTRHMFDTKGDAEPYLGILDAVFMISYAVVMLQFILINIIMISSRCPSYT
jgi:hypothetical protein